MPITYVQFFKATGHTPVNDDLERVNCEKAGEFGHMSCGWCEEHNQPEFYCGCRAIKRANEELEARRIRYGQSK